MFLSYLIHDHARDSESSGSGEREELRTHSASVVDFAAAAVAASITSNEHSDGSCWVSQSCLTATAVFEHLPAKSWLVRTYQRVAKFD